MYKEFYLEDAEIILISYGSTARTVLHTVKNRRAAGEKIGFIELQTLWPFPYNIIRRKCANAKYIIVVEMNMGQMIRAVKNAVEDPKKVFLINRIDGLLITVSDIRNILRMLQGKGV
jgi:2-oxoglutarate ferredoxin oxidoreductase subunit alpha